MRIHHDAKCVFCTDVFRDGTALGERTRRLLRALFFWKEASALWDLNG